jgi:hypothetical protein
VGVTRFLCFERNQAHRGFARRLVAVRRRARYGGGGGAGGFGGLGGGGFGGLGGSMGDQFLFPGLVSAGRAWRGQVLTEVPAGPWRRYAGLSCW